ncbi:MAG: hypothetical protein KAG56_05845 [Sulfurovaceae bacterium]|nr:hypothetical protein [Sulfurovaceae bacterium]
MKIIIKKILSLSIVSSILLLNGCSSKKDVVSLTESQIISEGYVEYDKFDEEFGVVEDQEVDARIANAEHLSSNPTDIDPNFKVDDPSWTTKLVLDPDAFTADEYIQKPPVISYKHKFDTEFHDKPRWRSANE